MRRFGCGAGRARVPLAPWFPSWVVGAGFIWSEEMWHRPGALSGDDGVVASGLGGRDLEGSAVSAADGAGSGVQEATAQSLRLGFREVAG
jgi:hypothetical protein